MSLEILVVECVGPGPDKDDPATLEFKINVTNPYVLDHLRNYGKNKDNAMIQKLADMKGNDVTIYLCVCGITSEGFLEMMEEEQDCLISVLIASRGVIQDELCQACKEYEPKNRLFDGCYKVPGMEEMGSVQGPNGGQGTHVQLILESLVAGEVKTSTMQLFLSAQETLEAALKIIDDTMARATPNAPTATNMTLLDAWHRYIEFYRRPQFRAAAAKLKQADQAVEELARDLVAHGARVKDLRPGLAIVYMRIFQLLLIAQAYLRGVWE